jgi:hypothetical protein
VLAVQQDDVSDKYDELRAKNKKLRKLAGIPEGKDYDFEKPRAGKVDKLLKTAVKQNLDAAKHNATWIRMALNDPDTKHLGDLCRAVHYHMQAADELMAEAKKPKAYKKDVKKVVAEVEAMRDDVSDKRPELHQKEAIFVSVAYPLGAIKKRVGLK